MIICKSEPRISFGTQQQPYLFLSYLKNPYCFCLKLKKKPQNTHFQVYENFEFYSKKIEKNDFPCLEIMSILLGKCKIRKSKLYSYRLLSHCALRRACNAEACGLRRISSRLFQRLEKATMPSLYIYLLLRMQKQLVSLIWINF